MWRYNYTSSYIKVDLCAHTYGKIGTFTAEYIPPTFLTRTPSPFCAGSSWGLLSRKIFYFFSWLRSYSDSYPILFRISVVLTHYKFSLDILLVWFRYIFLDYNFGFCVFRFYISTRFYSLNIHRINFDLFQHCRFYTLTLQLFISSACYKQTFMLMWVCFMLVLAILRLSDVFSFVLGVVYRLGLK